MYRSYPSDDSIRRWRTFCRRGWHMAWLAAALWLGGLTLLFRVAPASAPVPRERGTAVSWWPAQDGGALDVRTVWTPSAFALSTPAGFSHSLRRERAGLPPPVQTARPTAAFLDPPPPVAAVDFSMLGRTGHAPSSPSTEPWPGDRVFPPRLPAQDSPRLSFSEGWESRLFSGIDFNFADWTQGAWSARVEMRFDAKGVPLSMLVAQSSGRTELDRRLARSAHGWRLLEATAPRTGVVEWTCPISESSASAEKGAP